MLIKADPCEGSIWRPTSSVLEMFIQAPGLVLNHTNLMSIKKHHFLCTFSYPSLSAFFIWMYLSILILFDQVMKLSRNRNVKTLGEQIEGLHPRLTLVNKCFIVYVFQLFQILTPSGFVLRLSYCGAFQKALKCFSSRDTVQKVKGSGLESGSQGSNRLYHMN